MKTIANNELNINSYQIYKDDIKYKDNTRENII